MNPLASARTILRHLRRSATPQVERLALPEGVAAALDHRAEAISLATEPRLGRMYRDLMADTWQRTLHPGTDGVFVVTGDIPAMWLRDSSAQMRPWVALAGDCPEVADMIAGVVMMQWRLIRHDPYTNAFNHGPTGGSIHLGDVHMLARRLDPWVWERKYELDSLGLPVLLAEQLQRATGSTDHLTWSVHAGLRDIVELWRREQDHAHSSYRFIRVDAVLRGNRTDTLSRWGRGPRVGTTGMTWQGFRPSDDACTYGYNVPAQLLALKVLRITAGWARELWQDEELAVEAEALAVRIDEGVRRFATLPDGSWAYECDGLGSMLLADDANMPSLLSLPLLSDVDAGDPAYLATRARILSPANPWWVSGGRARGIGSPHTPAGHVWPIALAVQGLTSPDRSERLRLAHLLADTTAGTARMHESFHVDDPARFTRGWFSWADMMFCELLDSLVTPG